MKLPFNVHKKAGAWFIAAGGTHQAFELAREHIFLAVHEYIAHQGWLIYTLGGVAVLCGAPCLFYMFKQTKGNTDDV